jgi:hypothetical protein
MSGMTRADFERLWKEADDRAMANKSPIDSSFDLERVYRSLDQADRKTFDEVIAEWLLDERSYDALSLIETFRIKSALPALASRLASIAGPFAEEKRMRTRRIIRLLEEDAGC